MSDQRRGVAAAATLLALVLLGGCFPGHTPAPGAAPNGKAAPTSPPSLTVTPATGATRVPISAEVGLAVSGGTVATVILTRAGSKQAIKGFVRDDGTSWVPDAPLRYGTSYTATVTARSKDGTQTTTKTSTFRTMGEPARQTGTGLYLFTGETYGVALPVVIEFSPPVPDSARANVQRRLFASSTPSQPGVWSWASGSQVWYRPAKYWQPGTSLTVRAALAGQPMGGGYYGDVDRSATVRIGQKVYMSVDNATKSMKVYVDDKLVRKIPVSLGKHSTPSSSGHLVVMSKAYTTIFDTTNEGPGGYRVSVNYAMRLTWGGEFIHSAPWSVNDQGKRNVSHGCINMSAANAKWLFSQTLIGDPVTIKGTSRELLYGNGWTDWDKPWDEYVKGSAI